jgi:hypothetical protein
MSGTSFEQRSTSRIEQVRDPRHWLALLLLSIIASLLPGFLSPAVANPACLGSLPGSSSAQDAIRSKNSFAMGISGPELQQRSECLITTATSNVLAAANLTRPIYVYDRAARRSMIPLVATSALGCIDRRRSVDVRGTR